MLFPVRLLAYCSIMEADECGRIEHIFKFGEDIDQGEISQSNLRGSTIANRSKATQSDNRVPFRKCRVRIVRGRYSEMHKIAP
jgi:hypothetical protein